jgi:hypothetical protein
MRYLVVRSNADGSKSKLARFAYNCDAQRFATDVSREPETVALEVLDTKLKTTTARAENGTCTFYKGGCSHER